MEEPLTDLVARLIDSSNNAVRVSKTELDRLLRVHRVAYIPALVSFVLPYKCIGGACKFKLLIKG